MNRKYVIYTENKRVDKLEKATRDYFDSFSTSACIGYYAGQREGGYTITIIADDKPETIHKLHCLCRQICCINTQFEVLLTEEVVKVTRIGQSGVIR